MSTQETAVWKAVSEGGEDDVSRAIGAVDPPKRREAARWLPENETELALCLAVRRGSVAIVQHLLPFFTPAECTAALRTALSCQCTAVIPALLGGGADPTVRGPRGRTALFLACEEDDAAVTARVLAHAPRLVDARGVWGVTPLMWACGYGCSAVVCVLLAEGASVHATSLNSGETALHFAAEACESSVVQQLIDVGAGLTCEDMHGHTPLHYACTHGHADTAALLLRNGATLSDEKFEAAWHEAGYPAPPDDMAALRREMEGERRRLMSASRCAALWGMLRGVE